MDFSQIKAIVFDLDGTLYEDTHHFDYYAERLKSKLPKQFAEKFEHDYELVMKDEHPLKIGRVYDVKQDLILIQLDNAVQAAFDWSGIQIEQETVNALYPDPIVMDLDYMLNVGDLWWVPGSIARHYGLTNEQSYEAFLETRKFMMGPDFKMNRIDGFKEALDMIKSGVYLILLTNSPEPDSEAILQKLDLHDVFHKKIFMGRKPSLTLQRFEEVKNDFNLSYNEILSIGDNWINEIRPVQPLGCSTIFIDSHKLYDRSFADIVVSSIKELIPILEKLK